MNKIREALIFLILPPLLFACSSTKLVRKHLPGSEWNHDRISHSPPGKCGGFGAERLPFGRGEGAGIRNKVFASKKTHR